MGNSSPDSLPELEVLLDPDRLFDPDDLDFEDLLESPE